MDHLVAATVDAPSHVERLVRRDRLIVGLALAGVTLLAWFYLVRMADGMRAAATEADMHAAMGMTDMAAWSTADVVDIDQPRRPQRRASHKGHKDHNGKEKNL